MRWIFGFLIFFFFVFSDQVWAVTVNIINYPSTITSDSFNIDVTIFGAGVGTNYLRLVLYKKDTDNYFGETWNDRNWYGGGDGKEYYPITIDNKDSTASATIQGRFGNPTISEFSGAGIYQMKVKRYTNSGSPASGDDYTPVEVQINVNLPSPTPTPAASPKASPAPKSTPAPTASPSPKSATSTPFIKASPVSSKNAASSTLLASESADILGETDSDELKSSSDSTQSNTKNSPGTNFPVGILFLSAGILLSGAAGFLAYQKSRNTKNLV